MTKIPSKTWLLIILLSIINLISYFISGETSNYSQDYFSANHIATTVFNYENQIGLALMIAILAINLKNYKKFLLLNQNKTEKG